MRWVMPSLHPPLGSPLRGGRESKVHCATTFCSTLPLSGEGRVENARLLTRREGIDQIGRFSLIRPDDLAARLAVHLLPLRQHHLMGGLQSMITGIGGEFDMAEERGHVGR